MTQPAAKRARLSMEDVLLELENEDEPMMVGVMTSLRIFYTMRKIEMNGVELIMT